MMRYKPIPTRETTMDESNRINSDSDSDGQINLDKRANLANNSNGRTVGSGHFDPLGRRIYLGLQVFSISTALLGLVLLCIWIFKYKNGVSLTDKSKMGNTHVIIMYTFMVGLNAYGVLVYRTFYIESKEKVKWAHAIISGINIVMAITGITLMFVNHNATNKANMYTLHSWIGLTTTILYSSQFLFGFIAFLKPGLRQSVRANIMPWHRFAGGALLVMAGLAATTGIAELGVWTTGYDQFIPVTFIANFAGICVLVSTSVSVYLLSQDTYRRPVSSELRNHMSEKADIQG